MTIAPLLLAACALAAGADASASADAPVILDFTASWCGPCQQMKPAVAQLAKGGYPIKAVDYDTSPLVRRYRVTAVPTFVVIDADGRELDRVSGYRPASDIAAMYRKASARAARPDDADPAEEADPPARVRNVADADDEEDEAPAPSRKKNPLPWETVVRIRVENAHGRQGIVEFGSGTIVHSTPDETIILTCAHIFKIKELGPRQYAPSKFPGKITVELSDGQLRQIGPADKRGGSRVQVHMVEAHRGEAIDYDFGTDVGLIRIRPKKRLPSTPVVAPDWAPKVGMVMTAVGCSHGEDATPWTTQITNPLIRGVDGSPNYEAIECQFAPKEGRSGGGLYTPDGKLAGVCDFAEPTGGHGLYATPRMIRRFLDKNDLTVCYAPDADRRRGGAMLAQGRTPGRGNRANVADTVRTQSPDEGPRRKRLTIPAPDQLNVPPLDGADEGPAVAGAGRTESRRKPNWSNERVAANPPKVVRGDIDRPQPAEMTTTPEIGRDPFDGLEPPGPDASLPPASPAKPRSTAPWKSSRGATTGR